MAVDAAAALTAVGGGAAILVGADEFPPEWLARTPFGSYAPPALILAAVVGGSALVAALETFRDPRRGGRASAVAGLVMVGWIGGELAVLPREARHWIEGAYLCVGATMLGLGLSLARSGPGDAARAARDPG